MVPLVKSKYPNTCIVEIECNEYFYYSYETCIGYKNDKHNIRIRLNNYFSRTTSKHVGKLEIGSFTPVDAYEFDFLIEKCQKL